MVAFETRRALVWDRPVKRSFPSLSSLFIRAIKKLRKEPYKGIHSVYSGFNQAFREYFNKDPVEVTTSLAQESKIVTDL